MTLEEIFNLPEFVGLDDKQAKAYGDETVVIATDNQFWRWIGICGRFSDDVGDGLYNAMLAEGMNAAAANFINPGFDLTNGPTRDKIDFIAAKYPAYAEVCEAIKELGITHGTRWQGWGVDSPTVEGITAARQAIADRNAVNSFCGSVWNPAVGSGTATPAQLKQLVAEWNP